MRVRDQCNTSTLLTPLIVEIDCADIILQYAVPVPNHRYQQAQYMLALISQHVMTAGADGPVARTLGEFRRNAVWQLSITM